MLQLDEKVKKAQETKRKIPPWLMLVFIISTALFAGFAFLMITMLQSGEG